MNEVSKMKEDVETLRRGAGTTSTDDEDAIERALEESAVDVHDISLFTVRNRAATGLLTRAPRVSADPARPEPVTAFHESHE